jgi:hypothetical protein
MVIKEIEEKEVLKVKEVILDTVLKEIKVKKAMKVIEDIKVTEDIKEIKEEKDEEVIMDYQENMD